MNTTCPNCGVRLDSTAFSDRCDCEAVAAQERAKQRELEAESAFAREVFDIGAAEIVKQTIAHQSSAVEVRHDIPATVAAN